MLRALNALIRQLSLFDPPPVSGKAAGVETLRPPVSEPSGWPGAAASSEAASFASLCRGPFAHIRVETGARLRDSWKVTWTRRQENLLLRVPAVLEAAPREAKEAALRWAVIVSKRPSGGARTRKPDSSARVERRHLEGIIRDALARAGEADKPGRARTLRLAANRRRLARLNPKGRWHDLEASLAAVNARYFGGALQARITWAVRLGGLSTHRLSEDGEGRPYHLITISRGYDSPEVTPEILGGVVYHECLHAVIPPRKEGGRRVVHGRDFREREKMYEHYREWREWHRTGLPKALRRLVREAGKSF